MDTNILDLNIQELLCNDNYLIPIYQRNYAWGVEEVTQLIQDIADYAKDAPNDQYYIGNLIVFPRRKEDKTAFETIDGQQRTTTLTILMCSIKKHISNYNLSWYHRVNISFEHRENSNYTLDWIFKDSRNKYDDDEINSDILTVYNKAWTIIEKTCSEKRIDISIFLDYFFNNVKILRICVPKETNLNHYFEIMNSRGEQLEQHEIIKSWLMKPLKDDPHATVAYNIIWEACSNMERYVQMNFNKELRGLLFDNFGTGNLKTSFLDFKKYIEKKGNSIIDVEKKSLYMLFDDHKKGIHYSKPWMEDKEKEYPESYHSLVTFPNFLLHVLKIMYPKDKNIVLDDKRLTKVFLYVLNNNKDKQDFSLRFIMVVLKTRLLFDKYIIKRKQEKWSLKLLLPLKSDNKRYYYRDTFSSGDSDDISGLNREIIMLLSMFHVSSPTQIYKNWLSAALHYVFYNQDVTASDYRNYLIGLSKAYMLDRYLLSDEEKVSFDEIIYENNGKATHSINDIEWKQINIDEKPKIGESIENFVLNMYDFILWTKLKNVDFEFTYRTSVEHFYPQHPTDKKPMDWDYLHSFGNLCLVSRGMNSKFTNNLPDAKYANFGDGEMMKSYSMKLRDMMDCIRKHERWDETKISEKEQEAKELIEDYLR